MYLRTAIAALLRRVPGKYRSRRSPRHPARPVSRKCQRARRCPHGRDRHHRRPRVRLRAVQDARLPAHEGGGVHVRRRPLAQQYARRARRPGAALHQGDVLPDRQACAVASRDPQGGRRSRSHHRRPHLVARQSREDQRRQGDRGDREGLQRHQDCAGCFTDTLLQIPVPPGQGQSRLSRIAQHRRLLA